MFLKVQKVRYSAGNSDFIVGDLIMQPTLSEVTCCVNTSGRVRLRGQLSEERPQHPHRLHPLHVHLRRHRCAALQGQVLLLHRRVQRSGEGLQVNPPAICPGFCIVPRPLV